MSEDAKTLAEKLRLHERSTTVWQAADLLERLSTDLAAARAERDEARDEVDECRIDIKTLAAQRDALQKRLDEAVVMIGIANEFSQSPALGAIYRNGLHWDREEWSERARAFLASQSKEQKDG